MGSIMPVDHGGGYRALRLGGSSMRFRAFLSGGIRGYLERFLNSSRREIFFRDEGCTIGEYRVDNLVYICSPGPEYRSSRTWHLRLRCVLGKFFV
jgi:hypothetical protein